MERAYKRVLLAAVAIACLPAGAALAGSDFVDGLDAAFERWDRAAILALEQETTTPDGSRLAGALGAFLDGDYAVALESGKSVAGSEDEQIRLRADGIVELATSWQAVLDRLTIVAPDQPGVALRVPAGQEEWGRKIKERLGSMLDPYYEYFSVKTPLQPEVVFVEDLAQLAALSRVPLDRLEESGTVATVLFGKVVLLSPASFPNGYAWDRVLCHEMVHLVLHLKAPAALPVFFEEGIARYLEEWSTQSRPSRLPRVEQSRLYQAVEEGLLLSREQLAESFWKLGSPLKSRAAFLQALFLVRVLVQKSDENAVKRFVESVAAGEDWKSAQRAITGLSDNALFAWAKGRWRNVGNKDAQDALLYSLAPQYLSEKQQQELDESRRTVMVGDLLWGREHKGEALKVYQRLPAGIQGTPDVAWRIVRLLLELERVDEAVAQVEAWLPDYPDDSRLLYVAALAYRAGGQEEKAGELAERAWLVNPFANETIGLLGTREGE